MRDMEETTLSVLKGKIMIYEKEKSLFILYESIVCKDSVFDIISIMRRGYKNSGKFLSFP